MLALFCNARSTMKRGFFQNIRGSVGTAFRAVESLHHLLASEYPPRMRVRLVRAWLAIDRAKWTRNRQREVSLLGYRVRYAQWALLSYLFREIFINGTYLFQADTSSPTILDCGSNIGMSILFFKRLYPKSRIIGFEPDPTTFELLKSNVERNSLTDVDVYPFALSGNDGHIDFYHDVGDPGSLLMSVSKERMRGERITVPSRRLSSFLRAPVDLLKMDIEGAEEEVLEDLVASKTLPFVKHMFIEYHHHIDSKTDRLSHFLGMLENEGFGYHLSSDSREGKAARSGEFQDIRIYCYRKGLAK